MDTSTTASPAFRSWWQRPFDATTIGVLALCSGVILWNAVFPSFYYMVFAFALFVFWGAFCTWITLRLTIAGIGERITGRPVSWNGIAGALVLMGLVTVAVLTRLPMRAAFAFARAELEATLERDEKPSETFSLASSQAGPYGFVQQARRRCHHDERIYFRLANDTQAGFVHSPNGAEDLCFNSGSMGHLSGDWYWVAED